jgi:diguanylate cyclase (GGDEF)-like protein
MRGNSDKAAWQDGFGYSPGRMAIAVFVLQVLLVAVFIFTAQQAIRIIDGAGIGSERLRAERLLGDLAADPTLPYAGSADAIGRLLDLRGARFATNAAPGEIAVPLPPQLDAGAGMQLVWTPRRLGTLAWENLAPLRLGLTAVMLVLMGSLLWRFKHLADELERRRSAAREMAGRDSLTGLANRFAFEQRLEAQLAAGAVQQPFALFYLDLDGFKKVNDRLGHAAGDALLCGVAQRLTDALGSAALVARLGGDEFAIMVEGIADEGEARNLAARLHAALLYPYRIAGEPVSAPASIGVTLAPAHGLAQPQLLANADAALYAAKGRPRDRYVLFQPPAEVLPLSA